jgi:pilus assembly protein Flp/PilA
MWAFAMQVPVGPCITSPSHLVEGKCCPRGVSSTGEQLPNFKQKEIEMRGFVQKVRNFLVSEDGPTAVEYAVMLALIVIVALTAIQTVGTRTSATFNNIASKMPTS